MLPCIQLTHSAKRAEGVNKLMRSYNSVTKTAEQLLKIPKYAVLLITPTIVLFVPLAANQRNYSKQQPGRQSQPR